MSRRHPLLAAAAVPLLLVLPACGSSTPVAETEPAKEVTYLTSFGTFGRDAYAYVALEKGYFTDAGFKVTIRPGTGSVDVMKLLASEQADYGVADLAAVVTTQAKEKLPVRAVAAVHQKSLVAIASLDGRIDTPEKLAGASVADSSGSTVSVVFPAYAKAAGISADSVKWVPSAPQALPQLLAAGTVDGIGQFVVGKPLLERAASGRAVTMLPYADKLPDLYGVGLLTNTRKLDGDRAEVDRFVTALTRGLNDALDNPAEAAQILKKYQPTQDTAVAAAELEAMKAYVRVDGTPVGQLDQARIQRMIELFSSTGTLPAVPAPDDVAVFDVRTGS
ncbi:ABC transporter substrate-binding protein [Plantactinospora sp. GCM10030261]|uniref:ABC transporter substrate-binding protein n=1 Tax=Plantactinospora sp. GCM10030261 TaxID=3273420 RepID=UPI00361AC9C9